MKRVLQGAYYLGVIMTIAILGGAAFLTADSGLITPDNTDYSLRTASASFYFITLFAAGVSGVFAMTALWFQLPGRWICIGLLALPLIAVLFYRAHLVERHPPWKWEEREVWLQDHDGRMPDYYYRDNGILFPEDAPSAPEN